MTKILVLCTGNSCRSQMAEGWIKKFVGEDVKVYSAGVETHGVNPKAVETMASFDVDISSHTSNNLDEYIEIQFDYIITVCDNAKERCPFFPGKAERIHKNFSDPSKCEGSEDEVTEKFKKVCAEIRDYCREFVENRLISK